MPRTRTHIHRVSIVRVFAYFFQIHRYPRVPAGVYKVTTTNSHITWEFSCKSVKKNCKKRFFPAIFSKNFNWQVIPSWVIISYKIIKFASISYKICCEKCFIQNILQKSWQQFPTIFFFITKFISISYKKNFKKKLTENMRFFSSKLFKKQIFNHKFK